MIIEKVKRGKKSNWSKEEEQMLMREKKYFSISKFRILCQSGNNPNATYSQIMSRRHQLRTDRRKRVMKAKGTPYIKKYDNSPAKRFTQKLILSKCANSFCDILVLLGTTPDEYISLLFDYNIIDKTNIIHGYEREAKSARMLEKKYAKNNNVTVTCKNVISAHAEQFMDIDLMRTYKTQAILLKTLFDRQRKAYENAIFNFSFSFSHINENKLWNTLGDCLSNLTGKKIRVLKETPICIDDNNKKFIYEFKTSKSSYKIFAYYYADKGGPMVSISIQY
jgi:hypothetical protein